MNLNNIRRQVAQNQVQFFIFYLKLSSLMTVHYLSGTHLLVLRTIWSTVASFEGLVPQPNFSQVTNGYHWHIEAGSSRHSASEMLQSHKLLL